jgi:hypothetical protein
MKNIRTNFSVALFTFIVGISAFYLNSNIRSFITSDNSTSIQSNSTSNLAESSLPKRKLSNKIEIRFVRFVQGEREVEAEFEITNGTTENVYYRSFFKDSYAFPILKRGGKIVTDHRFRCGTGLEEHRLPSGEKVLFRFPKSEVTFDPTQNPWGETDKPTQIGF